MYGGCVVEMSMSCDTLRPVETLEPSPWIKVVLMPSSIAASNFQWIHIQPTRLQISSLPGPTITCSYSLRHGHILRRTDTPSNMHAPIALIFLCMGLSSLAAPVPSADVCLHEFVGTTKDLTFKQASIGGTLALPHPPRAAGAEVLVEPVAEALEARQRVSTGSGRGSRSVSIEAAESIEARQRVSSGSGRGRRSADTAAPMEARQRVSSGSGRGGRSVNVVEPLEARQRVYSGSGRGGRSIDVTEPLEARQRVYSGSGRGGRSVDVAEPLEARQRVYSGSGRGGRSIDVEARTEALEARQRVSTGNGRG
jgi:hypothetical protein